MLKHTQLPFDWSLSEMKTSIFVVIYLIYHALFFIFEIWNLSQGSVKRQKF